MKNPILFSLSTAVLVWLSASSGMAQLAPPIADINTQAFSSSQTASMVKVNPGSGEILVISIEDPLSGAELWRSNGTDAGTSLIRDIETGATGSEPGILTTVGNKVFFTARALNNSSIRNLWVTDGLPTGTMLVKAYDAGQGPAKFVAFNNRLFFEGSQTGSGRELWRSDGTEAGTLQVANINTASGLGSAIDHFFNDNNTFLYFAADNGLVGRELWRTAADQNSTTSLFADIAPGGSTDASLSLDTNPEITKMNSRIYLVADANDSGSEIWTTDGTESGTIQVADIAEGTLSATPRSLKVMTVTGAEAGTYLFFSATDGQSGRELYRTNGQTGDLAQTVRLKDIREGAEGSGVNNLTVVGNTLFFTANSGSGIELFSSSGRQGNSETNIVADINAGGDSTPANLTPLSNRIIFTAQNTAGNLGLYASLAPSSGLITLNANLGTAGETTASNFVQLGTKVYFILNNSALWSTDGTAVGTKEEKNFQLANGSSSPSSIVSAGAVSYFSATDGITGRELWKTDGTESGTVQVKDIRVGAASSSPESITVSGENVYFTAEDSDGNRELWITDGTDEGTLIVKTSGDQEINTSGGSDPTDLTDIDGVLYFSAVSASGGREPWRINSDTGLAETVGDLVTGTGVSDPTQFTNYKDDVYFVSRANGQIQRLRKASAAAAFIGGAGGPSAITGMVPLGTGGNQRLYFAGTTGQGIELWKSDGTDGGTEIVLDINPGSANANPTGMTVVGNVLFFAASNGTTGTANGTELWRTNGTLETTRIVRDINPGVESSSPQNLTEAGGKLFFTADNGTNGRELWVSTSSGASMLVDIAAGAASSNIADMKNIDGILCFSADDGINGRELWISDGTAQGTRMLEDLTGPVASSNPANFTSFQGQLLYSSADTLVGNELRIAFIGPNIELADSNDNQLVYGTDFDLGTVAFKGTPVTKVLTIKNTGRNTLSAIKPLISGVNASEFTLTTPKAKNLILAGDSTTLGVKFTPKEGGLRTATLSILSNDADENPFILRLVGNGDKDPTITSQPESLMLYPGEEAEFEATASGIPNLTYQWRKGSAKIAGANNTSFTIGSVTLKDAGAYNLFVQGNPLSGVSNSAQLGVVQDNFPVPILAAGAGKAAVFKVTAAGNQLTYQWLRDGTPLSNDSRITGATTKTMTIKGLTTDDTDIYTCQVTNPGGSKIGGSTQLNVFGAAPIVVKNQNMDDGVISGSYTHQILVDPAAERTPLTYSAKGLPAGLKLDAKSGLISGKPTKSGDFPITVTAKNTFGSDSSDEQTITIAPFPDNIAGVYIGTVAHDEVINGHLGGRLDLSISGTGSFTGSLMLGATKIALKGAVDIDVNEVLPPGATLNLLPSVKSGIAPITLTFAINTMNGEFINSSVTTDDDTAIITGWRALDAIAAAQYDGFYTFGLELGDAGQVGEAFEDLIPQGWSFGSFKAAKGKLKIAGRTADGDKITCSSVIGTNGNIAIFQTMYTPLKGSLLGNLQIEAAVEEDVTDNTTTGDIEWVRPADPKSKTRSYVAGFGMPETPVEDPVPLEAVGAFYAAPTGLILGLTEAPSEVELTFQYGGVSEQDAEDKIDAVVTVNQGNKITVSETEAATKLAVKTPTGGLSGNFALGTGAEARKSVFTGVLIKDGSVDQGVGFFTLPQVPGPGETLKTSPIFGGKVELREAP